MKLEMMVAALAILASPSAFAQSGNRSIENLNRASANYIYNGCTGSIADKQRNLTPTEAYLQGECFGTVKTLIFFSENLPSKLRFCMPREVTNGQAVRVVVAYMDANPAKLHENFKKIAGEALHNAWPC